MNVLSVLRFGAAFLPVCLFLASLVYIDSYQLVPMRQLLKMIGSGGVCAAISYLVNQQVLDTLLIDYATYTHAIAPAVEEVLKLLPVLFIIRRKSVGFVIGAAICGFGVGAGFALVENLYYLSALHRPEIAFWMARGFGTAVMHGGTTCIAAMAVKALFQRSESERLVLALPGLAIAYAIHSLFNQFILSPLASAVVITAVLPALIVLVFSQSERYVQQWLGRGFDVDTELLAAIGSGDFGSSRPGRYLQSLRQHFAPAVVADMLCFLRINAELSVRAKGVLMLREAGLPVHKDAETTAKLVELEYLKSTIGRTGLLALAPIVRRTSHDVWQLRLLEESS